jgi:EAL domain-containing protein (putative c-di-GMP-specific phosphodiesterase class I)
MSDPDVSVRSLGALRDMGIRISVDDFGTGYSSLSYLKNLPVHALKTDISFVRDLATDQRAAAIVNAIIGMGHSLGLEVVARGVETEHQLVYLRDPGCDRFQGFLLAEPDIPEVLEGALRAAQAVQPAWEPAEASIAAVLEGAE